jgi:hypothetical protein
VRKLVRVQQVLRVVVEDGSRRQTCIEVTVRLQFWGSSEGSVSPLLSCSMNMGQRTSDSDYGRGTTATYRPSLPSSCAFVPTVMPELALHAAFHQAP